MDSIIEKVLFRGERNEKLWLTQAKRLVSLGFHTELGMTEDEYKASMPAFQPQLPEFKGRFETPLLIDPRVSIARQLDLLGINTNLTPSELTKLSLAEKQYEGNAPYQIWVHFGKGDASKGLRDLKEFEDDEQPLTVTQGLALFREKPQIIKDWGTFIPMAGSFLNEKTFILLAQPSKENPNEVQAILEKSSAGSRIIGNFTRGKIEAKPLLPQNPS